MTSPVGLQGHWVTREFITNHVSSFLRSIESLGGNADDLVIEGAASETGIMQMKTILRNIFAVIIGLVVGGAVNMTLITVSPHVIPPPEGVDVTKYESLSASIHLFEPKHFVFPFLAHALGTLAGALLAFLIAGSYRSVFAYIIGAVFLAGGIAMAFMIPGPVWFIILDLGAAYIPMAWLGTQLGCRILGEAGAPKT